MSKVKLRLGPRRGHRPPRGGGGGGGRPGGGPPAAARARCACPRARSSCGWRRPATAPCAGPSMVQAEELAPGDGRARAGQCRASPAPSFVPPAREMDPAVWARRAHAGRDQPAPAAARPAGSGRWAGWAMGMAGALAAAGGVGLLVRYLKIDEFNDYVSPTQTRCNAALPQQGGRPLPGLSRRGRPGQDAGAGQLRRGRPGGHRLGHPAGHLSRCAHRRRSPARAPCSAGASDRSPSHEAGGLLLHASDLMPSPMRDNVERILRVTIKYPCGVRGTCTAWTSVGQATRAVETTRHVRSRRPWTVRCPDRLARCFR